MIIYLKHIKVIAVIPVETLEIQMASVIRMGLRTAMRRIEVGNISDPLHDAVAALESSLYAPMYAQIVKTYAEGYVNGGELIARRIRSAAILTAATPIPAEDPRIAKAAQAVVYGVKGSLGNHKNEIQAVIRDRVEKGATSRQISGGLMHYFDDNRVAADRFARTTTNDVYNRAHLDRYEDSGVVDGVQFSAHIDTRTTDVCLMMNGTIWALGDSAIQVPPLHFSCRSRLVPYWGGIPKARNFKKEFGSEFVTNATKVTDTFRSKYWSPMPHTKASATYQRAYIPKNDIKTITNGLNLAIKEERAAGGVPDIFPLQRLKDMIRYRKINAVKSTISDRFGQSLLLDKFEERYIVRAIKSLVAQADSRIAREIIKRKKIVDAAWKKVLATRTGISKIEKDILYYRKRMKADPANVIAYQKIITSDTKRLKTLKASEQRRIIEWNKNIDMKPSATTISLEAERERYEDLLGSLNFRWNGTEARMRTTTSALRGVGVQWW